MTDLERIESLEEQVEHLSDQLDSLHDRCVHIDIKNDKFFKSHTRDHEALKDHYVTQGNEDRVINLARYEENKRMVKEHHAILMGFLDKMEFKKNADR